MIYLATINFANSKSSRTFQTCAEAMRWLDAQNNNHECTTYIEEYDENWQKKGGFIYTEAVH